MSGVENFIRGIADNQAAQIATGEWVDLAANLGASAVTIRAVCHVGGQAINLIWDKAKKI